MATTATKQQPTEIIYPDSDGKLMADNTQQADAMTIIYNNLRATFADDPNVFVAIDLLWYPVGGNPRIRVAPDVLVALGRPKGHRGSYKQWEEGGVALPEFAIAPLMQVPPASRGEPREARLLGSPREQGELEGGGL